MTLTRFVITAATAAALTLASSAAWSAPGDPTGHLQKIVGDTSAASPIYSSAGAAMDGKGNLVVIWVELSPITLTSRIVGQRLAPDGSALGNPFVAGPEPALRKQGDSPVAARIAMADDGRFVIAWNSTAAAGHTHVRAFDADAKPTTPDIDIVLSMDGLQLNPAVAIGRNGEFAVAWAEQISASAPIGFGSIPTVDVFRIRLQRFEASGARRGFPIEVGTATSEYLGNRTQGLLNHQIGFPALAIDDDGVTSVVWSRDVFRRTAPSLQLAAFDTRGRRMGPDISIPDARSPSLAVDRFGRRLVAFLTGADLLSGVQRFDPSGAAASQRVNTLGPMNGFNPQIAVRPNGDALLVVDVGGRDGARVQVLDAGLNAVGPLEVMAANEQLPAQSCVPASSRASIYAVVCSVDGRDPANVGVYVQRFSAE